MSMSQDKERNIRKILIICCITLGILTVVFLLLIWGIYATDAGSQKGKEKVKKEINEEVDEIEEELGEKEQEEAEDKLKEIAENEDEHRYTKPQLGDQIGGETSKGTSGGDSASGTKEPVDPPAEVATPPEPVDPPAEVTTPPEPVDPPAEVATPPEPVETPKEYVWRGDSSKDFTVTLASGSTFTLSEQAGKVVLVNFWTTWCGPCCREMPAFERLYGDYGNGGDVRIVAIDCGESTSTVNSFISSNGYTFPIGYDTNGSISAKYSVSSIPYTVIFNKDGTVYTDYIGAADAETQYREYKSAIEGALANQ